MKAPLALLAPLLATGCLADYALPSGLPSARLKVAQGATPMICVAERPTRLVPDDEGYARIPAGRAITLVAQFEGHDFVCMPAVSFVPVADASYGQTFRVVSRSCTTSVQQRAPQGMVAVAASEPASFGCAGRP